MGARRTSTVLLVVGACLLGAVVAAAKVQPLDVEWKDVSCSVGKKQLLQSVSGKARAGKLLAVMGPSGSGKTTFLDALAAQIPYSKKMQLHGKLRVGGAERKPGQDQAYVKQEDVFYSQLTVKETLMMAARLRLPSSMSLDGKTAMVDELMNKLGLSKVADTIVGDEKTRGISGGERKRLSIACQLFGTPSLIFCDEPTTGLDSFQAERVMSTLRQLAKDGHTVICSIHQPRSSIFRMFDDLIVLSEGQVVFRGPAKGVASYFRSKGHSMPANTNPGEFAIDLVSVDYASEDAEEASKRRISRFADDHRDSTLSSSATALSTASFLGGRWLGGASSTSGKDKGGVGKEGLVAAATEGEGEGGGSRKMRRSLRLLKKRTEGAGPLEQFRLLLSRSWRQVNRAKFANMTRVVANLGSALVFGSIFWKLGLGQSYINDRVGLLQTSVIQCAMSTVAKTLVTFPTESAIVKAERSLKMYSMLPYFLSKMIAELPISALFPTIFGAILYPMTGLHPKRDRFLNFLGVLTIEAFTASAMGMLIGCLAKDGDAALAIGPPIMTIFILFSGFYITQDNVPGPLRWVKDASLIKHAFEALCVNELKGLEFECDTKSRGPCIRTGEQMLERVAFGGSTVAGATLSLSKVLGSCWALTYLTLALGNPRYQTMADPSLLAAPQPSSAADASTRVAGGGLTNALRSKSSSKNSSKSGSSKSNSSKSGSSMSSSEGSSKSGSGSSGRSSSLDIEAITTAAVASTAAAAAADRVGSDCSSYSSGGGGGGGGGLRVIRAVRQLARRRRRRRQHRHHRLRRQENRANINRAEACAASSAGQSDPVVGAASRVARKGAVVPLQLRTPKRL